MIPMGLPFLLDNFTPKNKRTLSISVSIFFLMLTFIFGMDFGFIKMFSKPTYSILKLLSIILSLFIIFVFALPLKIIDDDDHLWYVSVFLQFLFYFIILQFSKYTVYDFFIDLNNIDVSICKVYYKINILLWLYSCILYFARLFFVIFTFEVYIPESTLMIDYFPYPVYSVPVHGVDFMFVVLILIYFHMYYYIKEVKDLFICDLNVLQLKKRFTSIVDLYEKIRPLFEKLIIVGLIDVPKMMILIYNTVKFIVRGEPMISYVADNVYALFIFSNIVILNAVVQMLVFQVDALKIELHKLLLDEEDAKKCDQISRLLKYMKVHKLCRPVAGVVPVDMTLVTTSLGIFTTYMIVVVQFTHLVE